MSVTIEGICVAVRFYPYILRISLDNASSTSIRTHTIGMLSKVRMKLRKQLHQNSLAYYGVEKNLKAGEIICSCDKAP